MMSLSIYNYYIRFFLKIEIDGGKFVCLLQHFLITVKLRILENVIKNINEAGVIGCFLAVFHTFTIYEKQNILQFS